MIRHHLLAVLLVTVSGSLTGCASWSPSDEPGTPFTLVVLPDTQCYCDTRLAQSAEKWGNGDLRRYFTMQTEWIRDDARELNVAFVLHEGDIVQTDYEEEWEIAAKAMSILDGEVPYCLCLGNHDMGYRPPAAPTGSYTTANDRKTLFNEHFPRWRYETLPWFGGTYDRTHDNAYYTFHESGMRFLILALEFKPRDEILEWASEVVREHSDHRVIVLTHSYLDAKNERTTEGYEIAGNLGEDMWRKFVSRHENIFMVLCGHVLGEGRLTSTGEHGNEVHQLLSDYQGLHNGGESWLRYMTFHPFEDKIEVYTYNPALDKFMTQPSSRFTLPYAMLGTEAPRGPPRFEVRLND